MQFNLDKRFIEILNEQGHKLTWDQLRAAYNLRKEEREADPLAVAKKRREGLKNALEVEKYRQLLSSSMTSKDVP